MTQNVTTAKEPAPVPHDSTAAKPVVTASPKAVEALTEKKWNTKNLGLRLAADLTSAACAASLVAPAITIIDRSIMENASGRKTLKESVMSSIKSFVVRPQSLLFSKPFALICMVYGGTYLTANTLDTVIATVQNKPATLVTAGTEKFVSSSTANIGLCLIKDQAFARLYGPGGPPRPVPLPSYILFTVRDCMTIFASFNVPPLLGPILSERMSTELQKSMSGQTVAQFLAPASVQIISTPLHLLGLDLYNRPAGMTWQNRWEVVKKNWGVSTVARISRIVPAFGFGGVVNSKVRKSLQGSLQ